MIIRAITSNPNGCKVYLENGRMLILTYKDNFYQGNSIWGHYWGINDLDIENGKISNEEIINYHQLPEIIKSHIERVLSEVE